jgi:hypothetical protein
VTAAQAGGLGSSDTAKSAAAAAATARHGLSRGPLSNAVWQCIQSAAAGAATLALPDGAVLGLAAVDPRLATPLRHKGAFLPPAAAAAAASTGSGGRQGPMNGNASAPTAVPAAAVNVGVSSSGGDVAQGALKQLLQHWPGNGEWTAVSRACKSSLLACKHPVEHPPESIQKCAASATTIFMGYSTHAYQHQ